MTEPLDEFRARYEADDNVWWMTECGDHMNLFDAACERIDDLNYRLRAFKFMLDRETAKTTRLINVIRQADGLDPHEPALITTDQVRDALRSPYAPPPEGWEDFGTHANDEPVPELRFSLELHDDGLPLWEQVVPHRRSEQDV